MTDTALFLKVESQKKSGWIAALLNLFLPGAGYIYCGRWFLGIFAFFFVGYMLVISINIGALAIENAIIGAVMILVIDGFLCAGRYNKKLVYRILSEEDNQDSSENPEHRTCPHCAEKIRTNANLCKHCGHDVTPDAVKGETKKVCSTCNGSTPSDSVVCQKCNAWLG